MHTRASFRLFGDEKRTASIVTDILGLTPSRSFEAGSLVSPGRSESRRRRSGWFLASAEHIEADVELATSIGRVLDLLEPAAARVWELVDGGYDASWFCYVASNPAEHAVELDRNLMTRLLKLPGDL